MRRLRSHGTEEPGALDRRLGTEENGLGPGFPAKGHDTAELGLDHRAAVGEDDRVTGGEKSGQGAGPLHRQGLDPAHRLETQRRAPTRRHGHDTPSPLGNLCREPSGSIEHGHTTGRLVV